MRIGSETITRRTLLRFRRADEAPATRRPVNQFRRRRVSRLSPRGFPSLAGWRRLEQERAHGDPTRRGPGRAASGITTRSIPLGGVRAFVFCNDDQLHRSPDPELAQTDARQRARLDECAVRSGQRGVPGSVCGRVAPVRQVRRSLRNAHRLRRLDRSLELGRGRSRRRCVSHRLLRGTPRARPGRGRKLPIGDQSSSSLVPEERARLRDGAVQLRNQRRRHRRARDRAVDGADLGLALGVRRRRHRRFPVASAVDPTLRHAGKAPHPRRRAGVHPKRRRRDQRRRRCRRLGHDPQVSPGLVIHRVQVPDRSGVVVLPDLAARLLQKTRGLDIKESWVTW